jgi:trehalose-6-phosphatase
MYIGDDRTDEDAFKVWLVKIENLILKKS